jgi:hypothetical protein
MTPFAKMDGVLGNLGVRYEKKWMFAEAIGAKEGYKYETTSGTFELYYMIRGVTPIKTR